MAPAASTSSRCPRRVRFSTTVTAQRVAPATEAEIADAVREAAARGTSFEIVGHGTKRDFGRPVAADAVLDVSAIAGILKYEPEELVLTVKANTSLTEIDAALSEKRQILGFEPADWGPLFGSGVGHATIAGILAANASGPRRVKAGAVRDSTIGCRFVNGSGETIKAGGRVIKNVTGFDLPKLMCGAFGTLGVLSELTIRVSPAPERVATLVIRNCGAETGLTALRQAARLAVEPTGLAYLPAGSVARVAGIDAAGSDTALIRVEGTVAAIGEKLTVLRGKFADYDTATLQDDGTAALFREIGNGGIFAGYNGDIWRLCVPASEAHAAVEAAEAALWYADWAGGLLWLGLPGNEESAVRLRRITTRFGGHATLMRATSEARSRLAVF